MLRLTLPPVLIDDFSIPYVRFDGTMSARKRQETLAQFSVPVQNEESVAPVKPSESEAQAPTGRRTRPRSSRKNTTTLSDDVEDDGQDADFIVIEDSDDDDDDEEPQMKAKSKRKGKTTAPKITNGDLPGPKFSGPNPKVMLISLKAGALGLNLTVANNVYLYVFSFLASQYLKLMRFRRMDP